MTKTDPQQRTHEALTPAEREDIFATLDMGDMLGFVETVKDLFPNVFDYVIAEMTRTQWAGAGS